ncbi:MAG: HAMP domain-containing protein [Candidatus Kapabacteria bacterium]|nr:HAMP domain-containing protein [Ignavibacteriota bacterium]MCW5884712.1 HAMP domain-containing protein [Candidatus Kapabacteria bacterium]
MKSLSWKIFFGFLLVIFTFTGLIMFFSYKTIKQYYVAIAIKNLQTYNDIISSNIIEFYDKNQLNELRAFLIDIGSKTQTRITIIDSKGNVVSDSDINPQLIDNLSSKIDVEPLISGSEISYYYLDQSILHVSSRVNISPDDFIILRVGIFFSEIINISKILRSEILLIAIFIIIFAIVFVLSFSYKVIKPISELTRASRKVALGDFDNKVFIPGNDEISHLARNFNQMTEKLKDYFVLAESQQDQYLTLISSLQAGLIVLDKQGKIVIHNKSFENICKTNIVKGRFVWELIPPIEFGDLIKAVVKKKKHITKEIEFHNLIFICSANYIESKSEVVVLFHDITSIKKLENVKRDFVVNVTHELRTPLTAIKGFIETLEDDIGSGQDITPYIEIIKRHTERLISIVQDLLTLSEVEQKTSHIQLSKANISTLFDSMIRVFEQKINTKGIKLITEIEEGLPEVIIDPFRIEQVLINLIDNAIKYTDSGYVKITACRNDGFLVLKVEDTGLGIPKEHHNRLFERFYTVDRSRSRKVGGTGLGLSIVKHIILLHEGDISIESDAGRGTKFIIQIPQKEFVIKGKL